MYIQFIGISSHTIYGIRLTRSKTYYYADCKYALQFVCDHISSQQCFLRQIFMTYLPVILSFLRVLFFDHLIIFISMQLEIRIVYSSTYEIFQLLRCMQPLRDVTIVNNISLTANTCYNVTYIVSH